MNSSLKSLLKPDPTVYFINLVTAMFLSTVLFAMISCIVHTIHMYAHADCVPVFRESLGAIIGGILDYSVGFQSLAAVRFIMQCL